MLTIAQAIGLFTTMLGIIVALISYMWRDLKRQNRDETLNLKMQVDKLASSVAKLDVFEHRLIAVETKVQGLGDDRHEQRNTIQRHEYRLDTIEHWKNKDMSDLMDRVQALQKSLERIHNRMDDNVRPREG